MIECSKQCLYRSSNFIVYALYFRTMQFLFQHFDVLCLKLCSRYIDFFFFNKLNILACFTFYYYYFYEWKFICRQTPYKTYNLLINFIKWAEKKLIAQKLPTYLKASNTSKSRGNRIQNSEKSLFIPKHYIKVIRTSNEVNMMNRPVSVKLNDSHKSEQHCNL